MVYQFASKELSDAREMLDEGRFYVASRFVANAKADIDDAPFEFGIWKDKFDQYADEFQHQAGKDNPNKKQLESLMGNLDKFVGEMEKRRAAQDEYYELKE